MDQMEWIELYGIVINILHWLYGSCMHFADVGHFIFLPVEGFWKWVRGIKDSWMFFSGN